MTDRLGRARRIEVVPTRRLACCGALALGVVLCGCGEKAAQSSEAEVIESRRVRCDVGKPPDYFVPGGGPGSPLALLGCARLGVSGKQVEFSGDVARIGRTRSSCINPAYNGRGQRGIYIPTICALEPPLSRFAVRDADQPRQAVRGYAFVIWGTTGAATEVVARFKGGTARAAVFKVRRELARTFDEPPFGLFVVELPLSAACVPITVVAEGSTERIPPRTALCNEAER